MPEYQHKNDLARYVLTERLDRFIPSEFDPKAQAFKRHSGIYDLRDSKSDNVICATGAFLKVMRATQAKWNSNELGSI